MRQNLGLGLSWCEGKCLLFSASGYFLGLRETRLSGDLSSKWPLAPSGSIWLLGWPRRIVPTYRSVTSDCWDPATSEVTLMSGGGLGLFISPSLWPASGPPYASPCRPQPWYVGPPHSVVLNPVDTAWRSFWGVTQAGSPAPLTPAFWLVLYGASSQQAGGRGAAGGSRAERLLRVAV